MPARQYSTKTILITMDGVDQDKLCELTKNDRLPFFKQLLTDNSIYPASSIFPASEPVDMLCGASTAMHGFYAEQQLKPDKYRFVKALPSGHNITPFTKYLGENGFKSLLIDVPHAELAGNTDGVTILNTQSPILALTEAAGLQNVKNLLSHTLNSSDSQTALTKQQQVSHALDTKVKFIKVALTEQTWDLAYINLADSWYQNDSSNELGHSGTTDSDVTQQLYQLLDHAIAKITQHLSSHDNIIIVSRSNNDELPHQQFIEPVLRQLGLLKLNETVDSNINESCLTEAANSSLKNRLKGFLWPVRNRLNRLFTPSRILWEETRAFQLPGDRYSYLRINLLGREQHGIVTPGVEYDGLLLGIAAELNELRVEPGGERAIKNISFPRRDMPGPYHDSLPDIAIEWNQDLTIHGLHSSSVCLSTDTDIDHSNEFNTSGFILVSGKNTQPIPQIADIDFRSVASTVLALFSLDQPQAYQLPSLVKYDHAVSKPLQKVAS